MNIPDHLRYSPHHLWAGLQPDGTVRVGITDHAQETLGDIVFVDAPASGAAVEMGHTCGVIESVKAASDLHAPLSGEVVATNEALLASPELVNEAPYDTWIFSIRPTAPTQLGELLDAAGYRAFLEQ